MRKKMLYKYFCKTHLLSITERPIKSSLLLSSVLQTNLKLRICSLEHTIPCSILMFLSTNF